MSDPILHLLGLAKKAGRLEVGEEPVGAVARARQAKLILVASDATPNTCRRASHFGEAGNVLWLTLPCTKADLGRQVGRGMVAMLAITDAGFAATIAEKLAALDQETYGEAAVALREKATRVMARQKEKRQHEKNLLRGKQKPWAAPPNPKKEDRSPANQSASKKKPRSNQSTGSSGEHKKPFPKGKGLRVRPTTPRTPVNKTLRNEVAANDE